MSDGNIRCFIAIHIPPMVQSQILAYIDQLKRISQEVRWIKGENIHLTLKFLGEVDSKRVESVKKYLHPLSDKFSKFRLQILGSGCFPQKKRPRVFWLGMEQSKDNPLFSIHNWIDSQLVELEFEKEKRRFSPHLTVGRVRAGQPVEFLDLFRFLENNPFTPVNFQVDEIFFMQSYLKPTGAEYSVIESYPLK